MFDLLLTQQITGWNMMFWGTTVTYAPHPKPLRLLPFVSFCFCSHLCFLHHPPFISTTQQMRLFSFLSSFWKRLTLWLRIDTKKSTDICIELHCWDNDWKLNDKFVDQFCPPGPWCSCCIHQARSKIGDRISKSTILQLSQLPAQKTWITFACGQTLNPKTLCTLNFNLGAPIHID